MRYVTTEIFDCIYDMLYSPILDIGGNIKCMQ